MKIYLAGIGGTFMTGLARLMKESGVDVAGCDAAVWPPMSDQLRQMDITPDIGWDPNGVPRDCDQVIIGNVLSRGNPLIEAVLRDLTPFTSGPQWLSEHVLLRRKVSAIAGTHGKTTTTAMTSWILDAAGLAPGFLLGGMATNFKASSCLGHRDAPFVIEADEYDTAFFDKRPKFMHYRPHILLLNNLEFDHADIYPDLDAIKRQFHYLLRTVPGNGHIIYRAGDTNLQAVVDRGVWTPCETFGMEGEDADWIVHPNTSGFELSYQGKIQGRCQWELFGEHNAVNALAAVAVAYHNGVPIADALRALGKFLGVRRRLELKADIAGITVYDDFAHHPTEINASLAAVKERRGRILAAFEPRSNSMKMGVHAQQLRSAFQLADKTFLYQPADLNWDMRDIFAADSTVGYFSDTDELLKAVCAEARHGDSIVVMSNGFFEHLPDRIISELGNK